MLPTLIEYQARRVNIRAKPRVQTQAVRRDELLVDLVVDPRVALRERTAPTYNAKHHLLDSG